MVAAYCNYMDGHNLCNKSPVNGDVFFPQNFQEKFLDKRIYTFQDFWYIYFLTNLPKIYTNLHVDRLLLKASAKENKFLRLCILNSIIL